MSKINRRQISVMNIQYRYFPLSLFLDDAVRYGAENVELWGAAPHFHMEDMSYHEIRQVRRENRVHKARRVRQERRENRVRKARQAHRGPRVNQVQRERPRR